MDHKLIHKNIYISKEKRLHHCDVTVFNMIKFVVLYQCGSIPQIPKGQ